MQGKQVEALDNIEMQVNEGNNVAGNINVELQRQLEVIERTQDTTKTIQATQKRSESVLKYFQKNLQCDWCIIVMILLIILCIVVIIIIAATGKDENIKFPKDIESIFTSSNDGSGQGP